MIRKSILAATLLTVLSSGAVTVKQLMTKPKFIGVCRGTCSATVHCSGPCFCYIPNGTTGSCVSDPPGVKPSR